MEQYDGFSIEIGEGLATCTVLDHVWTIVSTTWDHLKSMWKDTPEDLIPKVRKISGLDSMMTSQSWVLWKQLGGTP
jgi:hypothetical protein